MSGRHIKRAPSKPVDYECRTCDHCIPAVGKNGAYEFCEITGVRNPRDPHRCKGSYVKKYPHIKTGIPTPAEAKENWRKRNELL